MPYASCWGPLLRSAGCRNPDYAATSDVLQPPLLARTWCGYFNRWRIDPVYGEGATQKIFDMYENAVFDDGNELIPCSCNGQQTMVLKVIFSVFDILYTLRSMSHTIR